MWSEELADESGRASWYAKATEHWESQEATINGVLGGYPETNGPDLRESKRFLDMIIRQPSSPRFGLALDAGAGIGRVTKGLLAQCFQRVDLVEPCMKLLEVARKELEDAPVERFISSSLQAFEPEPGRYDVIWAQWVLLYLPDDDLVRFLQRCKVGLRHKGLICVKENVVLNGSWHIDREDNSIMRTDAQYRAIFKRAGLTVWQELRQTCWPKDLFPVMMYALRPAASSMKRPASSRAGVVSAIGVPRH